jgi:hypothetical protein
MSLANQLREDLGSALGVLWSPAVAAISRARHARMFHPEGIVCIGHVVPEPDTRFDALAQRLAGPVLARFSAALWKGEREVLDVLGVALRFDGAQDLLFATIRSPFTMPFAPLATDVHDYLANHYWAVSPFEVEGVGRIKFRLAPSPTHRSQEGHRDDRLRAAVTAGEARFTLSVRRVFRPRWEPIATIVIDRMASVDQEALRFDPFHDGRGIVPAGLVHAIRRAVYPASQDARPPHA